MNKKIDLGNILQSTFIPIIKDGFSEIKENYKRQFCSVCKSKNKCNDGTVDSEVLSIYLGMISRVYGERDEYLRATRKRQKEGTLSFSWGNSMLPAFKENGLMLLLPSKFIEKEDLHMGDVIEFQYYVSEKDTGKVRMHGTCVHRIIDIKDGRYLTKGDNNKAIDGWFKYNDILGIVVGHIPCYNNNYDGKNCVILRPDLINKWVHSRMAIIQEKKENLKHG